MRESTVVRILFDHDNLYIGFWCFDPDPKRVLCRGMERDGSVLVGDHVQFLLDPFLDRSNGYAFAVSPDGGRWDALVSNNLSLNTDWNGLWEAKTSIDAEGWKAEVRIPLRSLSYARNLSQWGFNFSRSVPRIPESGRWNDPRPEISTSYPSAAGTLEGLNDLATNLGIEFTPYAVGRYRNSATGNAASTVQSGFDLGYHFTPSLAAPRACLLSAIGIIFVASAFTRDLRGGVAAFTALLIFVAGARGTLMSWLSGRVWQYFGQISYSLYLAHLVLGVTLINRLWSIAPHTSATALVLVAAGIGASVASAHLLHVFFERPSMALSRLIRY